MNFSPLPLDGSFIIKSNPHTDERGSFTRIFCKSQLTKQGLVNEFVQQSISVNTKAFTLRGLHLQTSPHEETKIVRCTTGEIFDVIVDLRADSKTFGKWHGVRMSASRNEAIYIPSGFAHGFLSLKDNTSVLYLISNYYQSESALTISWDDPALGINWPARPQVISDKDSNGITFIEFKNTLDAQKTNE